MHMYMYTYIYKIIPKQSIYYNFSVSFFEKSASKQKQNQEKMLKLLNLDL